MVEITKLQRKIVETATTISDVACDDPAFLHAVLCQVGLPPKPYGRTRLHSIQRHRVFADRSRSMVRRPRLARHALAVWHATAPGALSCMLGSRPHALSGCRG